MPNSRRMLKLFRLIAQGTIVPIIVFAAFAEAQSTSSLSVSQQNPRYFSAGGKTLLLTGVHNGNEVQENDIVNPPPVFNFTSELTLATSYKSTLMYLWRWNEFPRYRYPGDVGYPKWRYSGVTANGVSHQPWLRAGPGTTDDGGEHLGAKFDLTKYDQVWFDRLAARVQASKAAGMYATVRLFEGHAMRSQSENGPDAGTWLSHPFNALNNINGVNGDSNGDGAGQETHRLCSGACPWQSYQDAYVRKVVDTVGGFDNVLYEIANEDVAGSLPWQQHIVDVIHTYEQSKQLKHPVGISVMFGNVTMAELLATNADWISPDITAGPAFQDNPPPAQRTWGKPVIADTDHSASMTSTMPLLWRLFLRGYNPLLYWGDDSWTTPTQVWVNKGLALKDIQQIVQGTGHVAALDLALAEPHGELSSTQYVLANPGFQYLVYQQTGGAAFTVNLSGQSGKTFAVEWTDTVTHTVQIAGTIAGGNAAQSFTPPVSNPSVLFLHYSGGVPTTFTNKNLVAVGKCLTSTGAVLQSNVVIDQCDGRTLQQWTYTSAKELRNGTLCLDVAAAGTSNGANVQVYTCTGGNNQKWEQVVNAFKPSHVSGLTMCLDVNSGSSVNGTNVQIWTCAGNTAQSWAVQNPPTVQTPLPPTGLRIAP